MTSSISDVAALLSNPDVMCFINLIKNNNDSTINSVISHTMSQLDSHSVQRSPIICFPETPVRSIFVSGTDAHTVGVATAGSANLHMQHATYLQPNANLQHAANIEVQPTVIPQTTIHSQASSNCQLSSTLQFGLTLNSHTSSNFQIVSAPQPVTNIASLPNIEAKTTCTY